MAVGLENKWNQRSHSAHEQRAAGLLAGVLPLSAGVAPPPTNDQRLYGFMGDLLFYTDEYFV